MSPAEIFARVFRWYGGLHGYQQVLLAFATTVMVIELILKRFPHSAVYARWKHFVEALGAFWTAIILSIVYFLSVSLVSLFMKLSGNDPLDRKLGGATAWKPHQPNPLGPLAAARHQF